MTLLLGRLPSGHNVYNPGGGGLLLTFRYGGGGQCQYLGSKVLEKNEYLGSVNYRLRKIQYLGSEK